jgi:hypothetical protein
MNRATEIAASMVTRYGNVKKAWEMAQLHWCDNIGDRSNPDMAKLWEEVMDLLKKQGGIL